MTRWRRPMVSTFGLTRSNGSVSHAGNSSTRAGSPSHVRQLAVEALGLGRRGHRHQHRRPARQRLQGGEHVAAPVLRHAEHRLGATEQPEHRGVVAQAGEELREGRHGGAFEPTALLLVRSAPSLALRSHGFLSCPTRCGLGSASCAHTRHAILGAPLTRIPVVPDPLRTRGRILRPPRHAIPGAPLTRIPVVPDPCDSGSASCAHPGTPSSATRRRLRHPREAAPGGSAAARRGRGRASP